jgi:hypothetical protein
MAKGDEIPVSGVIKKVPPTVRPIVKAARRTVKAAAPAAMEIVHMSEPPRSKTYMWKVLRYSTGGANVVGIGTFPKYSTLFFYRGRELEDGSGMLEGGGRDARFIRLRTPADAERPAVKRLLRNAFKLEGGGP